MVNPRRHPPRLIANQRDGMPYMTYPLEPRGPASRRCDLRRHRRDDAAIFDAMGQPRPCRPAVRRRWRRRARDRLLQRLSRRRAHHRPDGLPRRPGDRSAASMSAPRRSASTTWRRTAIQGRGVMIDLEAHFGRGGKFVSYDELMRIMEADKVEVEEGDLVCFRTGYDRVILGMNKNPDPARCCGKPVRRARRARRAHPQLDHQIGCGGADLRQPRGRGLAVAALRGRPLRLIAVARPLPVQARRLSRRDLAARPSSPTGCAPTAARASC